jgi:hypothetical protein
VAELQQAIIRQLVPKAPTPDTSIPVMRRQVVLLQRLAEALSQEHEASFRNLIFEIFHGE